VTNCNYEVLHRVYPGPKTETLRFAQGDRRRRVQNDKYGVSPISIQPPERRFLECLQKVQRKSEENSKIEPCKDLKPQKNPISILNFSSVPQKLLPKIVLLLFSILVSIIRRKPFGVHRQKNTNG